MKNLVKGGVIAVAAVACASVAFAGSQTVKQSASENTLAKSLIAGEMMQADAQLVAQAAIPRVQTTASAQQDAAKAKQAEQAARQQQLRRQRQLRQQQAARRQQLNRYQPATAEQVKAAEKIRQEEAAQTVENPAEAFASFEATFVDPNAVSSVSTSNEQAVQNVEETLSPSAPTSSN